MPQEGHTPCRAAMPHTSHAPLCASIRVHGHPTPRRAPSRLTCAALGTVARWKTACRAPAPAAPIMQRMRSICAETRMFMPYNAGHANTAGLPRHRKRFYLRLWCRTSHNLLYVESPSSYHKAGLRECSGNERSVFERMLATNTCHGQTAYTLRVCRTSAMGDSLGLSSHSSYIY